MLVTFICALVIYIELHTQVKQLHDWLKSWDTHFLHSGQKGKGKKPVDSGAKKAVLLSGPPGIGKTTTAKVVSQMLGLQAIEVSFQSLHCLFLS